MSIKIDYIAIDYNNISVEYYEKNSNVSKTLESCKIEQLKHQSVSFAQYLMNIQQNAQTCIPHLIYLH